MNMKLFFLKSILFLAITLTFFLQNGVAQDYTQIRLPDGARARLGKGTLSDVVYSPDGTRLGIAGNLGIWVYDVQSGGEIELIAGRWGSIRSVSFSPDGETLAAGEQRHRSIYLWDVNTGEVKRTITEDSGVTISGFAFSVAFSPDGETLASGGWYGGIYLWDVDTGEVKRTINGRSSNVFTVFSVVFSPDGETLASGIREGTIGLWDVATGTLKHTLGQAYAAHWSDVYNVAFSPDGQTLASGSRDNTIGLWDVSTGTLKYIFTGHQDDVHSVSFSPDGQTVVSGGTDTIIYM